LQFELFGFRTEAGRFRVFNKLIGEISVKFGFKMAETGDEDFSGTRIL
jgi:hypothetical protein